MSGHDSQRGDGWGSSGRGGWNSSQQGRGSQQQPSRSHHSSWQPSSSSRDGPSRDPSTWRGDHPGQAPHWQHPPPHDHWYQNHENGSRHDKKRGPMRDADPQHDGTRHSSHVHNQEGRIPRRPKLDPHPQQAMATSSFSSSSSSSHHGVRHSNHPHTNKAQPSQSMRTTKKEEPQMMETTAAFTPFSTKKEEAPTKSEPSFSTTSIVNQVKVEDPNQTSNPTDASVMSPADWEQKLLSQFRFPPERDYLPAEAFVPDNVNRINKKKEASQLAIQKVMKQMKDKALRQVQQEEEEQDDDDSYVSSDSERKQSNRLSDRFPFESIQIHDFFNAVPDCLPLTMGFDVFGLRDKDEENCWCPCEKHLSPWHNQHELEGVVQDIYCNNSKYTPMGLMSHLRTEADKGSKGSILHYGLTIYMEHLYCKDSRTYRGGVGHKAMYQMNDANYKIAVAAEKRELHREILVGRQKLEEEKARRMQLERQQSQQAEQLNFLKKTNKDAFEKIKQLEEYKKALHVEEKVKTPVLSKFELSCYRNSMELYFGIAKKVASVKSETEEEDLCIRVDQENTFSLQNFFDKWSKSPKNKNNASLLFHDLNYKHGKWERKNYHGSKIISKWNVIFKNEYNYGRTEGAKEQRRQDTAIDEGGPTREFLSQCWRQMGDLKLPVEGGKDVHLFEKDQHGWVPISDDKLKSELKSALKETGDLPDDSEYAEKIVIARKYYCAIGRIMLHSIAIGNTIWSSSMTPMYQNWLLRGCRPGDEDYHKEDILKHLGEKMDMFLGYEHEFKDGTKEELTEENIFTKFIPDQYLDSREISLGSIQDGLTLGGDYSLPSIFRSMPLEAVQKLLFSRPIVTAQGIIDILVVDYCCGWEGSTEEREHHCRIQEDFFRQLCDILKEREQREKESPREEQEKESPPDKLSFLTLFVAFCTGNTFLPDPMGNPDFKIRVEFNFESQIDNFPQSHTCENTLKLPGYLYTNTDRDNFERILDLSIYGAIGHFDMM